MKRWSNYILSILLCVGFLMTTVIFALAQQEDDSSLPRAEEGTTQADTPEAEQTPVSEGQSEPAAPETEEATEESPDEDISPEPDTGEEAAGQEDAQQSTADNGDADTGEPAQDAGESIEGDADADAGASPKTDEAATKPVAGAPSPNEEENLSVAAALEYISTQLDAGISDIAAFMEISEGYDLVMDRDNAFEALLVYAVRHRQTENFPYEVDIQEDDYPELASIYWSMHMINAAKFTDNAVIRVSTRKGAAGLLKGDEKQLFQTFCTDEYREKVALLFL